MVNSVHTMNISSALFLNTASYCREKRFKCGLLFHAMLPKHEQAGMSSEREDGLFKVHTGSWVTCGHTQTSKLYILEVTIICLRSQVLGGCSVLSLDSLSPAFFPPSEITFIGKHPSFSAAASRLSRVSSLSCVLCFLTSCDEPLPRRDSGSLVGGLCSIRQMTRWSVLLDRSCKNKMCLTRRWAELWQNRFPCFT